MGDEKSNFFSGLNATFKAGEVTACNSMPPSTSLCSICSVVLRHPHRELGIGGGNFQ